MLRLISTVSVVVCLGALPACSKAEPVPAVVPAPEPAAAAAAATPAPAAAAAAVVSPAAIPPEQADAEVKKLESEIDAELKAEG